MSAVEVETKGTLPLGAAYIEYHGLGPVGISHGHGRQEDAWNNTYRAVRVIDRREGGLGNIMYAEFGGDFNFSTIYFHEFFDLDKDEWQLVNAYDDLPKAQRANWAHIISSLYKCVGAECGLALSLSTLDVALGEDSYKFWV